MLLGPGAPRQPAAAAQHLGRPTGPGSGIDVTATVVDDRAVAGQEYWVSFTFPRTSTRSEGLGRNKSTRRRTTTPWAVADPRPRPRRQFGVPRRGRGAEPGALVITLVADLIPLVVLFLLFRYGGRVACPRAAAGACAR